MSYAYAAMAGLQLAGGYFAAENIKKTAQLNSDIAEQNAQFAELDAFDAELEGFSQQARYQNVVDKTLGAQQASLAAADVDLSFGSASTIQDESRFVAQLNLMEIEKRAQEKSLGFKRQASAFRSGGFMQSLDARARAANAKFGAIANAASTGLTGYQRSIT